MDRVCAAAASFPFRPTQMCLLVVIYANVFFMPTAAGDPFL